MKLLVALTVLLIPIVLSGCASAPQAMVSTAGIQTTKATAFSPQLVLTPQQVKEIQLTTASVESHVLDETMEVPGQIETDPNLTTPVISLMPGRIEEVYAALGDRVKIGQPLCDIRSDEVAQIEADMLRDVLEFDADIERVKVEYALAKKTYDRKMRLLKEGIAAVAEVDEARSELDKSDSEAKALQQKRNAVITSIAERLRLFGVPTTDVNKVLTTRFIDNTFTLNSPRHGLITSRSADVGQLIDNVHDLFTVSDLSRVWLMGQVFERDVDKIKFGDPVTVVVDSYPKKTFRGKLDFVASSIEIETRTMPVRVTIENPDELLKPKMFARVHIKTGTRNSLAVPDGAIQKIGETYVAYVVKGPNTFEERKLELGQDLQNMQEIKSGLRAGEKVAVHGSLQLQGAMLLKLSRE